MNILDLYINSLVFRLVVRLAVLTPLLLLQYKVIIKKRRLGLALVLPLLWLALNVFAWYLEGGTSVPGSVAGISTAAFLGMMYDIKRHWDAGYFAPHPPEDR